MLQDWRWSSLGDCAVRQSHDCADRQAHDAPAWTPKGVQSAQWPPRPAGCVERVNAMVAREELDRLRSCVRRTRPFARRRLGAADGAAAGLGINAARSVAGKKAIACGRGDGFAAVRRSVPLQPSGGVSLFSPPKEKWDRYVRQSYTIQIRCRPRVRLGDTVVVAATFVCGRTGFGQSWGAGYLGPMAYGNTKVFSVMERTRCTERPGSIG